MSIFSGPQQAPHLINVLALASSPAPLVTSRFVGDLLRRMSKPRGLRPLERPGFMDTGVENCSRD